MLEEGENRIKSADLEQEEFQKTFQEKEMALQQKLRQLEQDWRAKLERVMEERSKHKQFVKKEIQALLLKLFKTEQLHQTQICDYEIKYRDSLKLVSELQRQIKEREVAVLQNKKEKLVLSLMTRLGSPKDVLTLQPNWPLFFTGETVTLRCLGRPFKHNGFFWYRNESNILVRKHTSHENIYTIAPVTEAHSGVYICAAESSSDPVRLNVSALPKATLTVEPKWHPLYNGEAITLRCEVDSYSNWIYSWYKDQPQMAVSQTAGHSVTGNRLTISGAVGSDQGQYWCEGRLEGREVTSQRSESINLTVAALPKATLTVEPKQCPLYSGETVTLRCEVDSYSNWTYSWYKDQAQMAVSQTAGHSVTGNRLTTPGAAGSDQGQYWCEGRLEGRKVTSQHSDSITVAALPKATLIVKPKWRPLYNGETVTLRCEVDSYSKWTHFWYRDHNQIATSLTKKYSVNITGAAGSHQGQYWCEGRLEGRNVTSQRSDSITLTVAGRLVFGLGAAPLLLASIILCMKWCRKPGSPNESAVKYTEEIVEVDL